MPLSLSHIPDPALRTTLRRHRQKQTAAITSADLHEQFLTPTVLGHLTSTTIPTKRISQATIAAQLTTNEAQKSFKYDLPHLGEYTNDYTRSGSLLLLAGRKGDVQIRDWRTGWKGGSVQIGETVRDCKWLHNNKFFALAQKKYVYIYDNTGMEIHCLKEHVEPTKLEFLPYHFLIASIGYTGHLVYQDTSTGAMVAIRKTRLGRSDVLCQNTQNSILHVGHTNGSVSLWTPSMPDAAAKMFCHRAPLTACAIDSSGTYMATAALDSQVKIWDLRNYQPLQEYYAIQPAKTLSISSSGLLAVGHGNRVTIWKDSFLTKQKIPYMSHHEPSTPINRVQFCPFEDVLGVGHQKGFSSLIVPGASASNYDALELNPYETVKQRQEHEVKALLEKIPPDMIMLENVQVGHVDGKYAAVEMEKNKLMHEANTHKPYEPGNKKRKKTKGLRKLLNRQKNVIDARKEELKKTLAAKRAEKESVSIPQSTSILNKFRM